MCGIQGSINKALSHDYKKLFVENLKNLQHRGPDAHGFHFYEKHLVSLGHTRLSIIDLSNNANQPMLSNSQDIALSFNGEIYNFIELREELINEGVIFFSTSDTEVILKMYQKFGASCFDYFEGQFAISIFDSKKSRVYLARDVAGEKPLYYTKYNNSLYFASELKALLSLARCPKILNKENFNFFMQLGHAPHGHTILDNIFQVESGSYLEISTIDLDVKKNYFWKLKSEKSIDLNLNLRDQLSALLSNSIDKRLRADVDVGIFLSGGLDSSIITGIASSLRDKIKTYTVSFPGTSSDESNHAQLVAKHFNTDHETISATQLKLDEALEIMHSFDSPIFDSSILPTFLISKYVRKSVKVLLGGDGGDELFGGYSNYQKLKIFGTLKFLGIPVKPLLRQYINSSKNTFQRNWIESFFGDEVDTVISSKKFFSQNILPENIFNSLNLARLENTSFENYCQYSSEMDFNYFLPENILLKVDRASMLNSIEVRAPFLDKELINFAFQLPTKYKISFTDKKILLKDTFKHMLPNDFNFNRKQGFAAPMSSYLMLDDWKNFFVERFKQFQYLEKKYSSAILKSDKNIFRNAEKIFGIVFLDMWLKDNQIETYHE